MKTIDIHGKPYVMVKDRVIHFNNEYPNGCIRSKMIDRIDKVVIFEAMVIPDIENPERYFTGHAEEEIGSSQINNTSALENCETSAVGRALAMMGIGADESFASADEVSNAVHQQGNSKPQVQSQDNDFVCPKCEGGVWDNRIDDIDGKKITNEKNHPAFKCKDKNCDFASWKCEPSDAGVQLETPPHRLVEDENYEEAVETADSELPF